MDIEHFCLVEVCECGGRGCCLREGDLGKIMRKR